MHPVDEISLLLSSRIDPKSNRSPFSNRRMALRTQYGIALVTVLIVIVLAYLKLTMLKVDPPRDPERTDRVNALAKNTEWSASDRQRHLNAQQSASLRIQLEQFASQKFWIIAETGLYAPESEQMKFGQQLGGALLSAGWIESQFILQRMGSAGVKTTKMATFSHGGDSGVVIRADRASIAAGRRLNTVLNELSIKSSLEPDDTMKDAILVFIGDQ